MHGPSDRAAATADPRRSWRAAQRREELEARARAAAHAGDALGASRALLLISMLSDEGGTLPLLPHVARLCFHSSAVHLERLSRLNRALYGVLECLRLDESHRLKAEQEALTAMFDLYRAQALEYLAGDGCANFEAARYTVQAAFYAVFSRLRLDGVLGEQTQEVLGVVDDFLHCVQLSVGNEVVHAMPDLEKALQQYGLKPI